ncbi:MAG: hypothetical protein A3J55_01200 [Candidatus Ryanbacteria bacterium RIFCSPHIGHO2_02_FULL_45_17b]|uniref:POTRA domain-containing protein n=1 Tax=Candidatus Ryanbacteria bacterium RIFCSPHIGHO2_01_FULL_45_22 TaxID=1802114 RepID=A0A1G2G2B0_9BACT|nr:MAG: hypothetical protein A2719_03670 [Candidatus Ryanbacteria bacterium RIFCSPHIGHO2_01_FULL_45_22]OGZ47152.1 MAG: hypothetical protein A3J55_01200 [Candidatus Ryanbacteria bacterium RIFCSPHIGHO2_02_FULL_45_17b]
MRSVLTQHRTKQKRAKMQKFFLRFGIFFVLVTGSILFLLLSPRLRFGPISLSGNASVSSEEIMNIANSFLSERVAWFFPRSNILLFRPHLFEAHILKTFPQLSTASVSRSFSRELALSVLERSPWGLYCKISVRDCFYIAEDGVLVTEAPQLSGNVLFRITDQRVISAFFMLGERAIKESEAVFLRQVVDMLADRYTIIVREVRLGRVFQDQTELLTDDGWYVLFDERTNKEQALENLRLVLDQHLTDRAKLEYIDIRFEGKVFYKKR